ncbi:MAG: glycosyltransferase [Pseudomonadota bacterium]
MLRTLAFSRDLTELGWQVTVLTSALVGQESQDSKNQQLIPDGVKVIRTYALDSASAFSIRGRYPDLFEWPDRYISWAISATISGYVHIKRHATDIIFSTYPIASAHLAAYWLAKSTRKPWIADFRDPMLMKDHPDTKLRRRAHKWVEQRTIKQCTKAVVTNDNAKQHYIGKYPEKNPLDFHVIENGYDEALFDNALDGQHHESLSVSANQIKILHSGTMYPNHRDPRYLFEALKKIAPKLSDTGKSLEVVLRATGYDEYYASLIAQYGLGEHVKLAEPVGYVESLKEMLNSDLLLLIQGESCNDQIPAKLYEYLRSGRPILALTHPDGATARKLKGIEGAYVVDNDSDASIVSRLFEIFNTLENTDGHLVSRNDAQLGRWSRRRGSSELDAILRQIQ